MEVQTSLIELQESEIPRLLQTFCAFLGKDALEAKLKSLALSLKHAGPISQQHWILPNGLLWFGLIEALGKQRLCQPFTPQMAYALHQVATTCVAIASMPDWKRTDIRKRLLDKNGGDIPALVELTTAARLIRFGASIEWMGAPRTSSSVGRSFDILGRLDGKEFEVECKAKTVDAGRRIARRAFFQFADKLLIKIHGLLMPADQCCVITIIVPGKFPRNFHRQQELACLTPRLLPRGGERALADGTTITVEVVSMSEAARWLNPPDNYEHRIIFSENRGEAPRLIMRSKSLKPDRMMAAMESDIHDALDQLTGNRPGLISCYVPGVESFDGTQETGTATWSMIRRTFDHPKASSLVSIALLSDPQFVAHQNGDVETPTPCVRFVANGFKGTNLGRL